jgi:hypothetical protein
MSSLRRAIAVLAGVCLSVLALGGLADAQSQPAGATIPQAQPTFTLQQHEKVQQLRGKIHRKRKSAWYWEDVMLQNHTGTRSSLDGSSMNVLYLKKRVKVWHERLKRAKRRALGVPHKGLWLCIHRQEGSWTDNASNNPHWGGLQMGIWFMNTYAPELFARLGKANKWPPLTQMWVAERAYKREGYSRAWLVGQWVPTASRCLSFA